MESKALASIYFWRPALRGLNRMGDVFIPQNGDLPSFSQYGGVQSVDTVAAYLPKEDIGLLNLVLSVFSILPVGVLKWIVGLMEQFLDRVGTLPSLLRQLNLGLRGLLFACYYAGTGGPGTDPLDVIGYHIQRVTE